MAFPTNLPISNNSDVVTSSSLESIYNLVESQNPSTKVAGRTPTVIYEAETGAAAPTDVMVNLRLWANAQLAALPNGSSFTPVEFIIIPGLVANTWDGVAYFTIYT